MLALLLLLQTLQPQEAAASAAEDPQQADGPPRVEPAPPGVRDLGETLVVGRRADLVGVADSASEGATGAAELARRPILRPGELLETVPGLIATQHTGAGKGNQFFLRGFNLDHGTDLAVRWNGVPWNLPTHAHGQGYVDLNPIIPELVEEVRFRKGPYYADAGDFSSAGTVEIDTFRSLPAALARVEVGSFGYQRGVVADSLPLAGGELLWAGEVFHDDGPWEVEDDYRKLNGLLTWSTGGESSGGRVDLGAYDGDWTATDHVARRAIDQGLIGRFGSLDPTSGGESSRLTLSGTWWVGRPDERASVQVWGQHYDLDLYSNFTYALDDPVNGDQFLQSDSRTAAGLQAEKRWQTPLGGRAGTSRVGLQVRNDWIENGLFSTREREVLSTTRTDDVVQTSVGVYGENTTWWGDWFRTIAGLRADVYRFEVDSDRPQNSGVADDGLVSPKLGLVFGPWSDTELYLSGGYGFHSNDARGTTLRDDPGTDDPDDGQPVDPLVQTRGAEVGVRTSVVDGLRSTLALWYLESDSELLFIGDAGGSEASRPSRRYGVEWANFWDPADWLTLDLDLALSHARFTEDAPEGDRVPNAIRSSLQAGVTVHEQAWFASLRVRYFGPRDLTEDGAVESASSTLVNLLAGWEFDDSWQLTFGVFNLLDADVDDIQYFYPSRLPGEPAGPDEGGFADVHLHPAYPRTLRLGLTASF